MAIGVIKPGLLVALSTSIKGGVSYTRVDGQHEVDQYGRDVSRWDTTKVVEDPAELKRAEAARSAARALIARECCATGFGALLCPESAESALDAAIAAARQTCNEFNETAQTCRVSVRVLKGRIARTDEEAARSIAAEVEGILSDMQDGIRRVDSAAIRDAAKRATEMGAMLEEGTADRVAAAVEAARRAARSIVKKVEKGGLEASEIARELRTANAVVDSARFAFVGSVVEPPEAGPLPAVEAARFADLAVGAAAVARAAEQAPVAVPEAV